MNEILENKRYKAMYSKKSKRWIIIDKKTEAIIMDAESKGDAKRRLIVLGTKDFNPRPPGNEDT